jgi:hypothetical protein
MFFASFHFTRYTLEKLKDQPSYFSSFLNKLSQNFTLSFFALEFWLPFCFAFASFHFRFTSDAKTSKIHFFRIEAKKIRFHFDSFRFEAKMIAFLLLFHFFRFISLCFASDFYVSHRCETSGKSTFLHRREKNFAFVSL